MSKPLDRIEMRKDGDHFFLSGKEVTEKEYRKVYPKPKLGAGPFMGNPLSGWPMTSMAEGVHHKQLAQARRKNEAMGVGDTEYVRKDRDYMPVFRDRAHRRRYLRAHGLHDNDGGYGDG